MALIRGETVLVPLEDESAVGEARRAARRIAGDVALGEQAAERAAIVATEASRNAVVHGKGGFVALRALDGAAPGIEMVAVDRGAGLGNVAAAMRDGHSTAGTAGQGLGAIRRLSTLFDVWSAPGKGTALVSEIREGGPARAEVASGAVCLARQGEPVCGDGWVVAESRGRTILAVVDGLGHGLLAHDAAVAGVEAVRRHAALGPAEIVGMAHAALRSTRGAAIAVLEVASGGGVRYAGIGNVSATIVGDGAVRRLVSLSGTVGHEIRRVQEFSYEWPPGAILVMHSDGLAQHWDLAAYPGLAARAPALVTGVLLRDFNRGRDDVTVLAARRAP
ncbi:MAG: SpoIIE family protein phosphatase [Anaeromyxobacteraceae bacterium]